MNAEKLACVLYALYWEGNTGVSSSGSETTIKKAVKEGLEAYAKNAHSVEWDADDKEIIKLAENLLKEIES